MIRGTEGLASAWYGNNYFGYAPTVREPEELKGKKLLILWGGEDISPVMYGQKVGKAFSNNWMSARDAEESSMIDEAVRLGIPILGICRGAQMLCAKDGGTLWQHVNNHAGSYHPILVKGTIDGFTNSAHHQMMRPTKDAEVLGISNGILSPLKWSDKPDPEEPEDDEPEIVYFPKLNALGVQGHPEWLSEKSFLTIMTKELVKEKLGVDL